METKLNDKSGRRTPGQDPAAYQSKGAADRCSLAIVKQPAETSRQKRAKQYTYTLFLLITLLCHGCTWQPGVRLGMDSEASSDSVYIENPLEGPESDSYWKGLFEKLQSDSDWERLFGEMGASHCWEAIQSARAGSYYLDVRQARDTANKVARVAIQYLARYKSNKVVGLTIRSEPNNRLTKLDPAIGELINLTELRLSHNELTDIAPLKELTNLTELNLSNNQLTDIAPLKGMTKMTQLFLSNNQLTDITPLKGMTKMIQLDLYRNQLTDITPLKEMTKMIYIRLDSNQLTDITPLEGMTKMTRLHLSHNQLTDTAPLKGMTKTTRLDLSHNQLTDIAPLQEMTKMIDLELSNNQLTDIAPLKGMTKMTDLRLSHNQLTDIAPLKEMTKMTDLRLSHNRLTDIAPLKEMTNLEDLYVDNNQLKCLSEKLQPWWRGVTGRYYKDNTWLEPNDQRLEVISVRQQAKEGMHREHVTFAQKLQQHQREEEPVGWHHRITNAISSWYKTDTAKPGTYRYLNCIINGTNSWKQGKRIIFFEYDVPFHLDRQLLTQEDIESIPDRDYYYYRSR